MFTFSYIWVFLLLPLPLLFRKLAGPYQEDRQAVRAPFFDDLVTLSGQEPGASAVVLKQPIIIAYIFCGVLVGPWGLGWITDTKFIEIVSHLGITLLLFLAGLCLHPQKLIDLFKKTSLATLINCVFSFVLSLLFIVLRDRL